MPPKVGPNASTYQTKWLQISCQLAPTAVCSGRGSTWRRHPKACPGASHRLRSPGLGRCSAWHRHAETPRFSATEPLLVLGFGFRFEGLGFGVWGLGFGVWGLGFGFRVSGFGFRVSGFGVWGSGFGVSGSGQTGITRLVQLGLNRPVLACHDGGRRAGELHFGEASQEGGAQAFEHVDACMGPGKVMPGKVMSTRRKVQAWAQERL